MHLLPIFLQKMPTKSNLKIPTCAQNVAEVSSREIKFTAPTPSWLRGTLWLAGPGTFHFEKGSCKNWFDGFAIATKIEIGSESVKITSKHVQTVTYKKAIEAQHPVSAGMMHPPGHDDSRGFFSKLMPFTPNDLSDNCVGIINNFADSKLYMVGDGHTVYEISPKNCSTIGHFNTQKVFGVNGISPEVVKDVRTGDLYVIGSAFKPTFHNIIVKMPHSQKGRRLEEKFHVLGSIPSRWKFGPCGLRNSFALTENYIIFIETPLIANLMRVAATFIKNYKMMDWLDWLPGDKVRIYLVAKTTGKVVKVEYLTSEAFLVLIIVNAYEENDKIILDLCIQSSPALFEGFNLSNMRALIAPKNYEPGSIQRFIIPIILNGDVRKYPENSSLLTNNPSSNGGSSSGGGIATAIRKGDAIILTGEEIMLNSNCRSYDLGVINPNYNSRPYSFAYVTCCLPTTMSHLPGSSAAGGGGHQQNGIAKIDLRKRNNDSDGVTVWNAGGAGIHHPWRPIFVPNPEAGLVGREDDGVLICVVSNLQKRQSDFLVVIDAASMKELTRAEFKDCPVASYYGATFIFS